MRTAILLLGLLAVSAPAAAQGPFSLGDDDLPPVVVRGILDISQQQFSADDTFDNVFGETSAPFWGAGLQVAVWEGRIYGEVGLSRIARDNSQLVGERVLVSGGNVFKLGIPLRSTIKSWKALGGYRFRLSPRIIPYVGAGITSYAYTEESDFALPDENLDVDRNGAVFQGGVEIRAHRWVGIAAGVERTRVTGIFGNAGLSQAYTSGDITEGADGESDLGGWAFQLRFIFGR